jgi:16S rRNA G966 N2-methylase RsmD
MAKRISQILQLNKPPALSTESLAAYKELRLRYEETFEPLDPYEGSLVTDTIEATFEAARYARAKVTLIENKARALRELEAKRAQASAEKKEVTAKRLAAKSSAPASEPEEALDHLVEEVDAILLEPPSELEYARAFQAVLAEYEMMDKLQMRAIVRRDNAIAQLERYRHGMGNRIKRDIDEIMAASAAGQLIVERPPNINDPAITWEQPMARRKAAEAQYLDKKPQPTTAVPATADAQQAAAPPPKLAAVPNASDVQPSGGEKKPASVDASAAADAQTMQPGKPESEPQQACDAPTATQVQQAAANLQKLAAVPDAPDVQPGGVDKEPAPVDASAAANAQKLEPAKPASEPQPVREAAATTEEQP